MKYSHAWQLFSFAFALTTLVLLMMLQNERRSHLNDLYELDVALARIPDPESPEQARFSRRILSTDEQVIFVGGIPRSGTTLMRAMLDAHPDIRCGEETMIIPNIIDMRQSWRVDFFKNNTDIQKAMDDALSAFLLEIIAKNGNMAKHLCNKDPFTAMHVYYLREILPNSRFILMIRDARAVVHSMIDRDVPVGGFNRSNPEQMLRQWNKFFMKMYTMCAKTAGTCLKVYYERLVQVPETEMRRILGFLDIPWSDDVTRHHELIGKEVEVNPHEFSTSQIVEEVNEKALTSWFDCFSDDTLENIDNLAPMLRMLGYDTATKYPDYKTFAEPDFYERLRY